VSKKARRLPAVPTTFRGVNHDAVPAVGIRDVEGPMTAAPHVVPQLMNPPFQYKLYHAELLVLWLFDNLEKKKKKKIPSAVDRPTRHIRQPQMSKPQPWHIWPAGSGCCCFARFCATVGSGLDSFPLPSR